MTTITRRSFAASAVALVAAPMMVRADDAPADMQADTQADPQAAGTAADGADEGAAEGATAPEVRDFSLGDPDAPVKITEYASFTCPHCADFHATVWKSLKSEYIDTGKVRFTLREVYFDRYGLWAALVARCGGELRYFGIADMLFDRQGDWATQQDPTVAVASLRTIGLTAGLTNEQLDACLSDPAQVDALIAHFEEGMRADQVEGTPTLFINGEKHPNMTWHDLKAIIDETLAG